MADREDNIGDTKPLVRIKAAISKLKTELKAMEVKIGVAEHSLLQVRIPLACLPCTMLVS